MLSTRNVSHLYPLTRRVHDIQSHRYEGSMLLAMLFRRFLLLAGLIWLAGAPLYAQVVISQIYGGGGNTGSSFKNDFIEIFNAGSGPVSINGWSVQYASSTGLIFSKTDISGILQPGQYYLVQQAAGVSNEGASLPTPDATDTIGMSATSGKVALVRSQTTLVLDVTCAIPSNVEDFVGYGVANCFAGAPASSMSSTTALLRVQGGCADTGSNSTDFATATPAPRNTATSTNPCGAKKVKSQTVAD